VSRSHGLSWQCTVVRVNSGISWACVRFSWEAPGQGFGTALSAASARLNSAKSALFASEIRSRSRERASVVRRSG
jgi:hypothetical protein